jgi:serine/threonine protein kinase
MASIEGLLGPAQEPDELGRLGPFRVLELLGQGGMGMVFQAEDSQLKRRVALKVMLPTQASSLEARLRFMREARAVARIEHDHIVPIYQVGEDRGIAYLAMPLLKGESLEDRLRRLNRLPIAEAIRIGRETCLGLSAAHALDIVHRDIKPANLFLETGSGSASSGGRLQAHANASFRVKILDFGLARAPVGSARITEPGSVLGTPAYMAPEQAVGKPVDARADLFSVGCVLYRMTTGQLPFDAPGSTASLPEVLWREAPSPRNLNPDLPRDLSNLISTLLAKDPIERPESAAAVAQELVEIGGRSETRSPSMTVAGPQSNSESTHSQKQPRAVARKKLLLVLAAVLVLSVFTIVITLRVMGLL